MLNIAPGTEFLTGNITGGDNSNSSMMWCIWIHQIVPCDYLAGARSALLWMQNSGAGCTTGCWWPSLVGYMPTCGERNSSPKRSCSPTILVVSFLQNELFLLREFIATYLPSWQFFRGLAWAEVPLPRGSEDRGVGMTNLSWEREPV